MRKQYQKRIVQKMVVFSLVTLSLIALLQLATQLPAGSAVGPQQQGKVTVYVPVTVYVQQPVPYPVTVTLYQTRSYTLNQTVNRTYTIVSSFVVLASSSDNIAWSYWSISSYTTTILFTNSSGVYTLTRTARTTVSGPASSTTAYVTALLGVPIQPEHWAYALLTVGGLVGLGFGSVLTAILTRRRSHV